MPRRKQPCQQDQTEEAIRRAGSIGGLERLAFWQPFCKLPGAQGLDAGVAELKRIIRTQAQTRPKRDTQPASSPRHA